MRKFIRRRIATAGTGQMMLVTMLPAGVATFAVGWACHSPLLGLAVAAATCAVQGIAMVVTDWMMQPKCGCQPDQPDKSFHPSYLPSVAAGMGISYGTPAQEGHQPTDAACNCLYCR